MSTIILTVAYEGMNRAGKGTQLTLLHQSLNDLHIPCIILRGDGSREGRGVTLGDPPDAWWRSFRQRLSLCHSDKERFTLWNRAAHQLARELISWKDSRLPELMQIAHSSLGCLLLDRSLISRLLLRFDETGEVDLETAYPLQDDSGISWKEVLPDLIFHLEAPKEVLLQRLAPSDPKHTFRRSMLEEKFALYEQLLTQLPTPLEERCCRLDATQSIEALRIECQTQVRQRLLEGSPTT